MTIAREIAGRVTRAAEEANAISVKSVELEIGDLAFLEASTIELWVRQALVDGPAKNAKIQIETASSTLACRECGYNGAPDVPAYHDHHMPLPPLECPKCGSANIDLEAKKDCVLRRIELEV